MSPRHGSPLGEKEEGGGRGLRENEKKIPHSNHFNSSISYVEHQKALPPLPTPDGPIWAEASYFVLNLIYNLESNEKGKEKEKKKVDPFPPKKNKN